MCRSYACDLFIAAGDIFNIVILEEEGKIRSLTNTKFHRNPGMSKTTKRHIDY